MNLKKRFTIGNLVLPNNIIFAPLTEYTDFAFRKFIRHFHKGLIFCEMVRMEALVRKKCSGLLKYTQDMRPIGAQIYGTDPVMAKEAAKRIEDLGFDLIDLNCGCPAMKVVKDGSGAGLLKNPKLIFKILNSIKSSVSIPLSVKTRLGWDEKSVCVKQVVKIAKEAGCSAVTIHGRTKKQGYFSRSDWDYIRECKKDFRDILIIGNGDLYTPLDVDNMFKETACDGVMIARGMLKNPNIAVEIEDYFNKSDKKNTFHMREAILKYINYSIEEKGLEKTLFDIRKLCGCFFRKVKNIKKLRVGINSVSSTIKAIELIKEFAWEK